MSDDPDHDRVQEQAQERQHERAEHTENILEQVDALLARTDYPTTSEQLASEYANDVIDMPNETESLGSVFDRIVDERFDSADQAREAVYGELTGRAGSDQEYNDQRDLEELDESIQDGVSESGASDM